MHSSPKFPWLPFFRLLRLPNVFTAWSDALMGVVAAAGALQTSSQGLAVLFFLIVATSGLYLGGMVLNDWFDVEEDRRARAFRPLPSGVFSLRFAATLGFGLLALGVLCASIAGVIASQSKESAAFSTAGLIPGVFSIALVGTILAYNGGLKATWFGPLAMGGCRLLNVMMAAAVGNALASTDAATTPNFFGVTAPQAALAAGIGVYIAGVTWFARREEGQSPRGGLTWGLTVLLAGIVLLGLAPDFGNLPIGRISTSQFRWLLLLIAGVVAARAARAIAAPEPAKVQITVKVAILTLIWLDAAIALRTGNLYEAMLIAALIAPALIIGRAVYST